MNIWMINTKDENPNDKMTWKTLKYYALVGEKKKDKLMT